MHRIWAKMSKMNPPAHRKKKKKRAIPDNRMAATRA